MLETAPSLSIYTNPTDGDSNSVNIDGTVLGSADFSFTKPNMDLIDEEGNEVGELIEGFENLSTEDLRVSKEGSEEYYTDLLKQYPNHPLVLMECANLLKNNGDIKAAEYCYIRATLADPGNGNILSRYAQLLWELYHDPHKALPYFEHSVQNAPEDSDVLAAYAKFLWEIEDGKEEESTENTSDPAFLKSYAQFLYQSKGDLGSAEEYYSRAILADPKDGKVLAQYAKLVWEHYHDQDKAGSYLEKAIQVAPQDSDVLAAYASFLWNIDDDEVDNKFLSF